MSTTDMLLTLRYVHSTGCYSVKWVGGKCGQKLIKLATNRGDIGHLDHSVGEEKSVGTAENLNL